MNDIIINPSVNFPSWETIESQNDKTEYLGYKFEQRLSESLYMCISCNNGKVICEHLDNIIYFSFCNNDKRPILTVNRLYSDGGYYEGINELLAFAESFEKTFCAFRNRTGLVNEGPLI